VTFEKHDAEKPALDLLPFVALEALGDVLTYGAKKYRPHGWRTVDRRGRYLAAALRHLFAYGRGEDVDAESNLPHLAHALACVAFLLEAQTVGLGVDDRANP
jgi:hypothetical protein